MSGLELFAAALGGDRRLADGQTKPLVLAHWLGDGAALHLGVL